MMHRLHDLIRRFHETRGVDGLSDRDLLDLGLSRDQMRHLASLPADAPDLVTRMGAVFGVDKAALTSVHGVWLDLLETCATCADRRTCRSAMEAGRLRAPADAAFCPNADSFILMQV